MKLFLIAGKVLKEELIKIITPVIIRTIITIVEIITESEKENNLTRKTLTINN